MVLNRAIKADREKLSCVVVAGYIEAPLGQQERGGSVLVEQSGLSRLEI